MAGWPESAGVSRVAGAREIDALGCIVAPGAIDLHTHYDAQLNWDPYATLSGWFGVTSVSIGQCGFGFAPTRPEDRDLNMRMMNRIEAIPLKSMQLGMRWDWVTFPEYLDSLDRQGLGVNVGALVPFSPLRGYVLGMRAARERTSVTEAELNQMKQILHDAMKAGAFGFSADKNLEDRTEDGSALAKPRCVARGVSRARRRPGGVRRRPPRLDDRHLHHRPGAAAAPDGDDARSGRPLHVAVGDDEQGFAWAKEAREAGLPVVVQQNSMDPVAEFTLAEYNMFDYMPNWIQPLVGAPEERAAKLRDTATRAGDEGRCGEVPHARTDWGTITVVQVLHERNRQYEGLSIADLAEKQQKHPLDAFLDLAADEGLKTDLQPHAGQPRRRDPGSADHQSPLAHFTVGRRGAHSLPHHQHVARAFSELLGA
jgi:N-acyl-D-aspartate/D-glutamate deacylase